MSATGIYSTSRVEIKAKCHGSKSHNIRVQILSSGSCEEVVGIAAYVFHVEAIVNDVYRYLLGVAVKVNDWLRDIGDSRLALELKVSNGTFEVLNNPGRDINVSLEKVYIFPPIEKRERITH